MVDGGGDAVGSSGGGGGTSRQLSANPRSVGMSVGSGTASNLVIGAADPHLSL